MSQTWRHLGLVVAVVFVAISMIVDPRATFTAASRGLEAWWSIVFPSLLPFFVISELAMGLGLVHFLGIILEPVMRPLFNVPGSGAFVMAVGYTSGAPIGAMLTASLRKQGLCTRVEAERLVAFTNNASPLFMLVAVAVGMFGNPGLGWRIAAAHYLANLTLGLALRFYAPGHTPPPIPAVPGGRLFRRAWQAMLGAQRKDGRPLGQLLGDAITHATQTLTLIGGFIIFFAVIIQIMTAAGVVGFLAGLLGIFFSGPGFTSELLQAMASGAFEMTLGARLASSAPAALVPRVVAVAMILGWSGLSIHAQVGAMVAGTDIRLLPFAVTRAAHGLLAGLFTLLLVRTARPVFLAPVVPAPGWFERLNYVAASLLASGAILAALGVVSLLLHYLPRLRLIRIRF